MKRLTQFLSVALLMIFLTACGGSGKADLLIGSWDEVETGSSILTYNEDGTFQHEMEDGRVDKGTWRVDGNILYTIDEGDDLEYNMTLTTLDKENLVVNVAGVLETTYKRKK